MADLGTNAIAELVHHFRTAVPSYEGFDADALADTLAGLAMRDVERIGAMEELWGRLSDATAALRVVSEFPITCPDENQDAANMAMVARAAITKLEP